MRTDTAVTREPAEGHAVLDAGKVAGGIGSRRDVRMPFAACPDVPEAHERTRETDDESAGAAHAGGAGKVARENDVCAEASAGEIPAEPGNDDLRVVTPAREGRSPECGRNRNGLCRCLQPDVLTVSSVDNVHDAIVAR